MALLLDGKATAKKIEATLREQVERIKVQSGRTPVLATILVGGDPASATYVKMKGAACKRVGMDSLKIELSDQTTTAELLAEIEALNNNPAVHGILLQHPVPEHINERVCFDAIAIEKDVDGVTCKGFGQMSMGVPAYGAATPQGVMTLLREYAIPIEGKRAVVVGRSPILGKPMALMLLNANATVTICHSRTENLVEHIQSAEIIIGAVGKPEFIKADWISPGTVLVDAGYHPGGIGDIELSAAVEKCAAYTPVPGGVGPMTIATLMMQTVAAAKTAL
jgi:methylenetetrahydrofolate dehydrogenase (NADP+) / methenyltetrahydrofolate cyclohydrolase